MSIKMAFLIDLTNTHMFLYAFAQLVMASHDPGLIAIVFNILMHDKLKTRIMILSDKV